MITLYKCVISKQTSEVVDEEVEKTTLELVQNTLLIEECREVE